RPATPEKKNTGGRVNRGRRHDPSGSLPDRAGEVVRTQPTRSLPRRTGRQPAGLDSAHPHPPPTTMPAVRGRGATRSPAHTAATRRLERPRDRLRARDAPRAEGPAPARIPGNPGTTERSQLHPRPTPRPDTPAIVRRHTPRSPPPPTTPPRRPPSRPIPERRRLHVQRAEVHVALTPMMDLVVDRVQDQGYVYLRALN